MKHKQTQFKHYYESDYASIEDIADIVMSEIINLKKNERISNEKDIEDTYVDPRGNIYVADTYPVWVEVIDFHGRSEEIVYEPDMDTAVLAVSINDIKALALV